MKTNRLGLLLFFFFFFAPLAACSRDPAPNPFAEDASTAQAFSECKELRAAVHAFELRCGRVSTPASEDVIDREAVALQHALMSEGSGTPMSGVTDCRRIFESAGCDRDPGSHCFAQLGHKSVGDACTSSIECFTMTCAKDETGAGTCIAETPLGMRCEEAFASTYVGCGLGGATCSYVTDPGSEPQARCVLP